MVRKKNSNSLAENRKARHDYFVEDIRIKIRVKKYNIYLIVVENSII